ncbi:MAG: protein kinase [Polyangiaceae bacterium]|nr:protein kinase [Polyangiaceae bacterium]
MKLGELIAGRFVIEARADEGGMGVVYRARDERDGKLVALKVLRGSAIDDAARFQREAELIARLRHRGVVRYVDHGRAQSGEAYIAMEWLSGEDLARRLSVGCLAIHEVVTLGQRVGEALGAAHAVGIVHRDVKPANLFLRGGAVEEVVVLDFGIARPADAARDLTIKGSILGTPSYMSPEQASGRSDLGPTTDVFALGVVLYECLTGQQPFTGESPMAVLLKIVLEEPPRIADLRRDVPAALERLVMRMLSKVPSARPADGTAVTEELARCPLDTVAKVTMPVPRSPSERPVTITTGERQLIGIALLAAANPLDVTLEGEIDEAAPDALLATVRDVAEGFHARVDRLLDGTLVASLGGRGAATDQAAQTARLGLAIRRAVPGHPLVLATGRAVMVADRPIGEAIGRATALLKQERRAERVEGTNRRIRIDDLTAALLDGRFVVETDGDARLLVGMRGITDAGRTLLGRPTPFVGRRRELAALTSGYDISSSEPCAQAVLVTGAPGLGKSRLRAEVVASLRQRDPSPTIWVASGDPLRKGSPFALLAELVRSVADLHDGEDVALRRQKVSARLGEHVQGDDLAFLGEIVGVPAADASIAVAAAREDKRLMGDHVRRAFEAWVSAQCAERPLVLVFEDLHWGDLPTVRLVNELLRDLADRPFFVVALARPEVHDVFPDLWRERAVQEIRLAELGRAAAEELVRHALGKDTPPDAVARLVERAGGNALFLEELIRASVDGRSDALPETVVAMVEARLQRFDPEVRRVLRAASIFGGAFWRAGVAALSGAGESLDASINTLVEREVVIRQRESRLVGHDEFRFRHALLREGAYAMLTNEDLQLGHRLAGHFLESAGERDPVVLAEHYERGQDPARAIEWYQRAAELALAGDDAGAVLERAERAIALGADAETLGHLRALQADACMVVSGNLERTEGYLAEALQKLPRGGSPWYRAATAMIALGAFGRYQGMLEVLGRMLEEERDDEIGTAHVFAWSNAIFFLAVAGQVGPARLLFERVERHQQRVVEADPAAEVWVHRARHYWAIYCDHAPERSFLDARRSAVLLEQAGNQRELDWSEIHMGYSAVTLGDFEEGERLLRKVVERNTRADFPRAVAQNFLAGALSCLGRHDEAMAVQNDANVIFRTRGNQLFLGVGERRLAIALADQGDMGGARRQAARASDMLFVSPPHRCYALAVKARAELALGLAREGLETAREAHDIFETAGSIDRGVAVIRLAWAEALKENGRADEARAAIRVASERLLSLADGISTPRWRDMYLAVPENALTLELAVAWGAK